MAKIDKSFTKMNSRSLTLISTNCNEATLSKKIDAKVSRH